MTRKKQSYLHGTFKHRRTEADYLGVLLDAVQLDEWREVVSAALEAAKAGDATARAWLAQYLVGKPIAPAPAPLTVVVQQISGRDPLVEQLAAEHVERAEFPMLHMDDAVRNTTRELISAELRQLEAHTTEPPETVKKN